MKTGRIVSEYEMETARRWAAAKFEGVNLPVEREPGLVIVERGPGGVTGTGAFERNGFRGGPLTIGPKQYRKGLMITTDTVVEARLPSAGKRFTAVIGMEANDDSMGGSAVFIVRAGGREVYRTVIARGSSVGVPVEIDLDGAEDFTIEIRDHEGQFHHDHSCWVDPVAELADGSEILVSDLPLLKQDSSLTADAPFSFIYGGKSFSEIAWNVTRSSRDLGNGTTGYDVTYTDPATGLEVRCKGVEYSDFPVVEWTLNFKNNGLTDTPIIENIRVLDMIVERGPHEEFILHHGAGCCSRKNDYQPFTTILKPNMEQKIRPSGGLPTDSAWPYFNIEWPEEGFIAAIGWPGEWSAEFARDESSGLRVKAGQELTHFILHPGEKVRSPLIALLFYRGDWIRAQNIWRRWLLAHNLPRIDGELPKPEMMAASALQTSTLDAGTEENQIEFIDRYIEEKIPISRWWMDAGWYSKERKVHAWTRTGTWEVDTERFPRGIRFVSDHAHEQGLGTILWFEPERVKEGTYLFNERRDWLLGPDGEMYVLNLGIPEAREWLTDHVDKLMTEQGIDIYRQDFNFRPLKLWRENDSEDRQGITEIRHIEGLLKHLDELARRRPGLLIDLVSSGHRRNDLEGVRRSVSFTRTDYCFEPVSQQSISYGLFLWMPYHGSHIKSFDPYYFRSSAAAPHVGCMIDVRLKESDYDTFRRLAHEWHEISRFYLGDFYPLTSYSLDTDQWMAWQFDIPEEGQGVVQAFRRQDSPHESAHYRLRNLDPDAKYEIESFDGGGKKRASGKDLMEKGLKIEIKTKPGSAVFTYKKL